MVGMKRERHIQKQGIISGYNMGCGEYGESRTVG